MKTRLLLVLITFAVGTNVTSAQAPFERLGQKALTGGDFRAAASYFEKAYSSDHSNMDALWLLGYASYHAADYSKSVNAFDKLISMKPAETAAYYYRGKAKLLWSSTMKDYKSIHRERLLLGA